MSVYYRWKPFRIRIYKKPCYISVSDFELSLLLAWYLFFITFYGLSIGFISETFSGWFSHFGKYKIVTYVAVYTFWYFYNKFMRQLFRYLTRYNVSCYYSLKHGYYSYTGVYILKWLLVLYIFIDAEAVWVFIITYYVLIFAICFVICYYCTTVYILQPFEIIKHDWVYSVSAAYYRLVDYTATIPYKFNYFGWDFYDSSAFVFQLTMAV